MMSLDFHLDQILIPPFRDFHHVFGTDCFGRDLLGLMAYATGSSALIAGFTLFFATFFSTFLGIAIGISDGWKGWAGRRFLEIFTAIPGLLIALGASAVLGPRWITLILALVLSATPSLTRLTMLTTEEILRTDYITAAHASGASWSRIIARHIVPGCLKFIWIKLPGLFTSLVLAETSLSFLGVGAPLGAETLGSVISQGKDYLLEAPGILLISGIPLLFLTGSLQLWSLAFRPQTR